MVSPINPSPADRGQVLASWLRILLKEERHNAGKVLVVMKSTLNAAARAYEATGDVTDALMITHGFDAAMQEAIEATYRRSGAFFGGRILGAIESGGKAQQGLLETKDAAEAFADAMKLFSVRWAAKKAKRIGNTTKKIIRGIIQVGLEAGEGVDVIARRIREQAGIPSTLRSRTIARTETHAAANYAQQAAADSTGIEFEREWLAAEDERTRPDHAEIDGTRVGKGEPFVFADGSQVMNPGDPDGNPEQVINCRCTTTFHAEY